MNSFKQHIIFGYILLNICACDSFRRNPNHYVYPHQIMYSWGADPKVKLGQVDTLLWSNGKLCRIAKGLPNGYTQWRLYSQNVFSDSVLAVTKNGLLNGMYSEHQKDKQIIGHFTNDHRDGLFILKKKGEIVLYEFWENGKPIQELNKYFIDEKKYMILTRWGDF